MAERLTRFHDDERGLEAMQVVMIIAIAALILGVLKLFWYDVKNWVAPLVANIIGWVS